MKRVSAISTRRIPYLDTFGAFQNPNFRLLWLSNLLSYNSRWMQIFLLSLFILDRTNSAFFVALVGFFGMVPMLLLGVFGGVLADRLNRQKLLMVSQASNFAAALIFTVFLFLEIALSIEILFFWYAYFILLVSGTSWAFDMPSRRSVVLDILGKARVTNGIAVDSIGMMSSMMLGPIFAGALTSLVGFSGGYVVVTLFYLVSVFLMGLVKFPPQVRSESGEHNILKNLVEGFQYVTSSNTIMAVILITVFMNVLLFPYQQMVPVIAQNVLGVQPWLIGILMGAQGLGALLGGVFIASRSGLSYHGRLFLSGSILALVMLILFSFSVWYTVSLPLLFILGLGSSGFGTMQSTIIILVAKDEMRGRALGIITLAIGTAPLGSLLIGSLASITSPSLAITINATLGLLIVGFIGLIMPSLRQRMIPEQPTTLDSIKPELAA